MKKYKVPRKCKNCRNGLCYGGFHKRLNSQIKELEVLKDKKISEANKERNPEKRKKDIAMIKENFDNDIRWKGKEKPMRVSNCLYCSGTGLRWRRE